jgi:hypothetical protein
MKNLILVLAAICATSTVATVHAGGETKTVIYKLDSIYYNRAYSNTPNPKCECDLDNTKLECPETFQSSVDQGEVCYDEYDVPSDWTYAQIFKRQ